MVGEISGKIRGTEDSTSASPTKKDIVVVANNDSMEIEPNDSDCSGDSDDSASTSSSADTTQNADIAVIGDETIVCLNSSLCVISNNTFPQFQFSGQ